jgi:hypothetical protein
MFEKKYGKCTLFGDAFYEYVFEYRDAIKADGKDFDRIVIGKDIITGTPIKSVPFGKHPRDLEDAVEKGIVKKSNLKNTLIINHFYQIDRKDVIDFLEAMTPVEAEFYASKINALKLYYAQKVQMHKNAKKNSILEEKRQEIEIMEEKERLQSILENGRSR